MVFAEHPSTYESKQPISPHCEEAQICLIFEQASVAEYG